MTIMNSVAQDMTWPSDSQVFDSFGDSLARDRPIFRRRLLLEKFADVRAIRDQPGVAARGCPLRVEAAEALADPDEPARMAALHACSGVGRLGLASRIARTFVVGHERSSGKKPREDESAVLMETAGPILDRPSGLPFLR